MSPLMRRILQLLALVGVQGLCLLASAGTLAWPAAWWYLGLYVLLLMVGSVALVPHRREVIEERSRGSHGAKRWDLWITRLMGIPTLGLLIVAGLDRRWHWASALPAWAFLTGVVLFVAGYGLVLWAMYVNRFFSQVVRIQSERGQTTITTGPYRLVRHPGYLGMSTSMTGATLLLGSVYGFACLAVYLVLIVSRTRLEDRTLVEELPGYSAFAARTRFRLLPGVW